MILLSLGPVFCVVCGSFLQPLVSFSCLTGRIRQGDREGGLLTDWITNWLTNGGRKRNHPNRDFLGRTVGNAAVLLVASSRVSCLSGERGNFLGVNWEGKGREVCVLFELFFHFFSPFPFSILNVEFWNLKWTSCRDVFFFSGIRSVFFSLLSSFSSSSILAWLLPAIPALLLTFSCKERHAFSVDWAEWTCRKHREILRRGRICFSHAWEVRARNLS